MACVLFYPSNGPGERRLYNPMAMDTRSHRTCSVAVVSLTDAPDVQVEQRLYYRRLDQLRVDRGFVTNAAINMHFSWLRGDIFVAVYCEFKKIDPPFGTAASGLIPKGLPEHFFLDYDALYAERVHLFLDRYRDYERTHQCYGELGHIGKCEESGGLTGNAHREVTAAFQKVENVRSRDDLIGYVSSRIRRLQNGSFIT